MTTPSSVKLWILFLGMALASCGHTEHSKDYSLGQEGPEVLEVNDFGRFWNRDKAEAVLQKFTDATRDTNAVVLVFCSWLAS